METGFRMVVLELDHVMACPLRGSGRNGRIPSWWSKRDGLEAPRSNLQQALRMQAVTCAPRPRQPWCSLKSEPSFSMSQD